MAEVLETSHFNLLSAPMARATTKHTLCVWLFKGQHGDPSALGSPVPGKRLELPPVRAGIAAWNAVNDRKFRRYDGAILVNHKGEVAFVVERDRSLDQALTSTLPKEKVP